MRTLVVLAVMVVVSTHQAYGGHPYGGPAYGGHDYGSHGSGGHAYGGNTGSGHAYGGHTGGGHAYGGNTGDGHAYGSYTGGGHAYGYEQPRYVGPLASSVPAGVGGKIIPVSDTSEVAAARGQFFKSYNDQLNTIKSIRGSRYGTPRYDYAPYGSTGPVHVTQSVHKPASSYGAPSNVYASAPKQVGDTPEVAAAKAEFFSLYREQAAAAAAAPDDYTYKKHY